MSDHLPDNGYRLFPTPYYLIDERILDEDADLLQDSLRSCWKNCVFSYSVKTNSTPWLLAHLRGRGFRAEIVSEVEYELAKKTGYKDSELIYNGPIKDRKIFGDILLAGGMVNLDSHEEIGFLKDLCASRLSASDKGVSDPETQGLPADVPLEVGLRVNIDFSKLTPALTGPDYEHSRFGYDYYSGELGQVIEEIRSIKGVRVAGLHLHSTTSNRAVEGFAALARFACEIASEYHLDLSWVDMGGGYLGGIPGRTDYRDYMPAICDVLREYFDPERTAVAVEPGVSLVSRCSSLVTTVKDVKHIAGENFVLIDGGRVYLNPQVTRRRYPHHFIRCGCDSLSAETGCPAQNAPAAGGSGANRGTRRILGTQMITGYTCMEYDRLFEVNDEEELLPGDLCIFDLAGGYTAVLAPNFIRALPAIRVRKTDGTFVTARDPWTADEILQKNHWE